MGHAAGSVTEDGEAARETGCEGFSHTNTRAFGEEPHSSQTHALPQQQQKQQRKRTRIREVLRRLTWGNEGNRSFLRSANPRTGRHYVWRAPTEDFWVPRPGVSSLR